MINYADIKEGSILYDAWMQGKAWQADKIDVIARVSDADGPGAIVTRNGGPSQRWPARRLEKLRAEDPRVSLAAAPASSPLVAPASPARNYLIPLEWEQKVKAYLEGKASVQAKFVLRDALGISFSNQKQRQNLHIGAIMKGLGWKRVRTLLPGRHSTVNVFQRPMAATVEPAPVPVTPEKKDKKMTTQKVAPVPANRKLQESIVLAPFAMGWELVTPEMAARYLATMRENRAIKKLHVDMLAREMKAGRWRESFQGIAFDGQNRLTDGQHRLAAIVKSGISVWSLVFRYVDESTLPITDQGIMRSYADVLHLMFGTVNQARVSALVRVCHRLELYPSLEAKPSNEALMVTLEKYEATIQEYNKYHSQRGYPMTIWGALCWARSADPTKVDAFVHKLSTLQDCGEGDPALALRGYFDRHKGKSVGQLDQSLYALTALRFHFEGSRIKHLHTASDAVIDYFKKKKENGPKAAALSLTSAVPATPSKKK